MDPFPDLPIWFSNVADPGYLSRINKIPDRGSASKQFMYFVFFTGHKNVQVVCRYPNPDGFIINWPPRSGSVIKYNGSADSDSKEKFTDAHTESERDKVLCWLQVYVDI